MKVPVHVLPVGDENVGGDVAIVSMVTPGQVRKFSRGPPRRSFVRSFGYKDKRAELKMVVVGTGGKPDAVLARMPIVLKDGLASYSLAFESGDQDRHIEARIDPQPGEVSPANNAFGADLAIDHTKIRHASSTSKGRPTAMPLCGRVLSALGGRELRGAYSSLQQALMEDPDVECTAVMPGGAGNDYSTLSAYRMNADAGSPKTPPNCSPTTRSS